MRKKPFASEGTAVARATLNINIQPKPLAVLLNFRFFS